MSVLPASPLNGQSAVVTGAACGIGRAIATELVAAGVRVLAADIAEDRLSATARELGVASCPVDVTDSDSVSALRERALSEVGPVDILVCNAGIASSRSVLSLSPAEWDRTFAVNVKGVFLCAQAFGADMAERGRGCIVNMSSVSGRQGDALLAHYSASKFAVIGFTQALARELGPRGVRANALCPGTVDTDMGRNLASEWGLSLEELAERDQIIKRPVAPREVGAAVVFLASMPIVTGQALNVDGGLVLS